MALTDRAAHGSTTEDVSRVERDGLGERSLPAEALYGIHTIRACANFAAGGDTLTSQPELLIALARVKAAAALANVDVGQLAPTVGEAIVRAAREVAAGRLHEHFPLEIVQGGGGTSTNMNMNEVLANRAGELLGAEYGTYVVHPNDHVNCCQSTNDVLPTALALATYAVASRTLASLSHLQSRLLAQADVHAGLDHLARTCLRDAVPIPVADVHRSQAHALGRAVGDLEHTAGRLLEIPLGFTAVGTGLGAADGYRELALGYLSTETGLELRPATNPCDGLASLEPFAAIADAMAGAGRVMARIAADLRLLSSGPVGGIGEVHLPIVQAGSSLMPGKVNPVLPELVMQTSYQLTGAAHTVQLAAGAGELEVSPMGPVVTAELLTGLERLGRVATLFAERCIDGLEWCRDRVEANLHGSLQDAVESAARDGYEHAAPSLPRPKCTPDGS